MRLLVAGSDRVDAGKTTFAVGLLEHAEAGVAKPRAGNDYWFDHDDCLAAAGEGRLYGKDARRLAAAGATGARPEALNPIHRLWTPAPGSGTGVLGRRDRAFLVDRVTVGGDERYVVNGRRELSRPVEAALPLSDATVVESLPEFNDVMGRLHRRALDEAADRIGALDRAVVESYADIARPIAGFEPDGVAVVEPGRARLYDGERYANACSVASGSAREGRLEERVEAVLELVEPRARVSLPPLAGERRGDPAAVADAYEPAYEALIATALE
jgi:predicted P-loop ATPase/GTPase